MFFKNDFQGVVKSFKEHRGILKFNFEFKFNEFLSGSKINKKINVLKVLVIFKTNARELV